MKNPCLLVLLFVIAIHSVAFADHDNKVKNPAMRFELNADWTFREDGSTKIFDAVVPGCVHTDLIRNLLIPDPFLCTNESACQWVGERTWIYESKPFIMDDDVLNQAIVKLRFNGLDTYASIYLNDHLILQADNAFRSWEVDVKKHLRHKQNVLRIIFNSPMVEGKKRLDNLLYPLPGDGLRAVTRKPQFHYGWDWGPKLISSGISKSIEVIAYDAGRLLDVYVDQLSVKEEVAKLKVYFQLHAPRDVEGELYFECVNTSENWTTPIALKKGLNQVELPLDIPYPYRWWCNDLGTPYLYEFNTQLRHEGQVIDQHSLKTGLRTIELIQQKDSIGESFFFELNGQPIFMKGANYIPHQFFSGTTDEAMIRKLLTQCKESHFNMLRVWGGGVYEDELFYRLCDEYGILVWQDFMFACSMYPADSSFVANVIEEANEQTIRLRNHPCMALWCGNNEVAEGWERWGWQAGLSEKEKSKLWRAYLDVFDLTLGKAVKKNTRTSYWMSSPSFGRADQRSYKQGDAHDWSVWHDEAPFEVLQKKIPRFMSEFGMQSFPSDGVVSEMLCKYNGGYDDHGLQMHQKHDRGFKLMDKYMQRWYPAVDHSNLIKYGLMTQVVQAEGIAMGIEAQRRAMPRCMGTLFWQLNDVWPAFSWSSIDYKGNEKLLQKYLAVVYDPQLLSAVVERDQLNIYWICDNGSSPEDGKLNLRVFDVENLNALGADRVYAFEKQSIDVKLSNGSTLVFSLPLASLGKNFLKNKILEMELVDSKTANVFYSRQQKVMPESDVLLIPQITERTFLNAKRQKQVIKKVYYKVLE